VLSDEGRPVGGVGGEDVGEVVVDPGGVLVRGWWWVGGDYVMGRRW
jgi:hypothetical protein